MADGPGRGSRAASKRPWLFEVGYDRRKEPRNRPTNFTKNPWTITKAKASDGDRMFARIEAKPKQDKWFRNMITGDERHAGDPGTGPRDILAYSSKPTAAGGAFRPTFFKGTVAKSKQEKEE